jgi:hypothetical protein
MIEINPETFKNKALVEIKPPTPIDTRDYFFKPHIFLGGAIDMGKAVEWQKEFVEKLKDENCLVLNPRRDDWDSSWVQSTDNPNFVGQVEWELKGINVCDIFVMYLPKESTAPVSLMELGFILGRAQYSSQKIHICCEEGYYRKGNVDLMCMKTNAFEEKVKRYDTLDSLIEGVRKEVKLHRIYRR